MPLIEKNAVDSVIPMQKARRMPGQDKADALHGRVQHNLSDIKDTMNVGK